jgi:hypothetical protein
MTKIEDKTEDKTDGKTEGKVEELLAKHPNLTRPEALKIIAEKNERKREKRVEKNTRTEEKKRFHEAKRPAVSKTAWSQGRRRSADESGASVVGEASDESQSDSDV